MAGGRAEICGEPSVGVRPHTESCESASWCLCCVEANDSLTQNITQNASNCLIRETKEHSVLELGCTIKMDTNPGAGPASYSQATLGQSGDLVMCIFALGTFFFF